MTPGQFFTDQMAQGGFKRTGNAPTKSQGSINKTLNKIRKGARLIQPKKAAAVRHQQMLQKLTVKVNKRAETAMINRLGSNTEGAFRLVKPDAAVLEELERKKGKKGSAGRNADGNMTAEAAKKAAKKQEAEDEMDKTVSVDDETKDSFNGLSRAALAHLDNFEETEETLEEEESEESGESAEEESQ